MISVDEALARVLGLAPAPRAETLPLSQTAGRALLEPATSRMTQPPFDASAMDGYAIRSADRDQIMTVIGESAAGHPWEGTPRPNTAIRISTGAKIPDGYDRVIMQEHVTRNGDDLRIDEHVESTHIRKRGGDFAAGEQLSAGRRLNAADIALLAAMNVPQVAVARRPRVAVLAGGDELVPPGSAPQEGQIISSNDLMIAAMVAEAGGEPQILPLARDTEDSLRDCFALAKGVDLIVTIGGASVGDHDLIAKVAGELGLERAFYKIAMRPGKPLMAGRLGDSVMLGLPGNPASAMVCAMLFMQPLIRHMQGLGDGLQLQSARLAVDLPPEGNRQHYLRATLSVGEDLPLIHPFSLQDSAQLSAMSRAEALMVRPADQPALKAGQIVRFLPLSR